MEQDINKKEEQERGSHSVGVNFSVWQGIKFGFGFGLGFFAVGLVIGLLSALAVGSMIAAMFGQMMPSGMGM